MKRRIVNIHVSFGLVFAALSVGCGDEGSKPGDETGQSGAGGQGGTVGGSSGSAGLAGMGGGAVAGGAGTGGGSGSFGGGGGAALTPEELRDATREECVDGCNLVNTACPQMYESCLQSCYGQADQFFETGMCALEFYETWRCINRESSAEDVGCSGSQPVFATCSDEQAAINQCVQG